MSVLLTICFFLGLSHVGSTDHPTSDHSFHWFLKICPFFSSYWEAEQRETVSVCSPGTGSDTSQCLPLPWVGQWGDCLPAPHWPLLSLLFSWEVKYGFCLLVTFSLVGRNAGLGMWHALGDLGGAVCFQPLPHPHPHRLLCLCSGVSPTVSSWWHRWWVAL